jgi:hypothetical protein
VTQAPDLIEPVVAFRGWRVEDGALVSPLVPVRWEDGTAVARCRRAELERGGEGPSPPGAGHEAPHPGCGCGIHAYFEPRAAVPEIDFRRVLGIVAVWGRVEVHPRGVRAQFARVQALGASGSWSGWHREEVARIAARLGVPLMDEEALEASAPEFGSPCPEELRRASGSGRGGPRRVL